MKSKAKNIGECAALFDIEVTKETLDKAFEEVYDEITKVANIPGFRVGKAPKDLVRKHYTKNAKDEVLKRLIPHAYGAALEQHKINPAGLPEIMDVNFEEGKGLSFKARVDTRPKFKLKDYKGIKAQKKKVVITDEDVNKTIENLRGLHAKYIAVEDRPAALGDYVVSDQECLVDGKSAHKKRENLWLYLEKDSFIPGLGEKMVAQKATTLNQPSATSSRHQICVANLVGMNKGETRDIEISLPAEYPDKAVAGKKATYRILAKEIKMRELPAVDDELAKDLGRTNLDDLKKEIQKELEERSRVSAEIGMENQLLDKVIDENVFAVPSGFVARQLDYMVEDSKKRLMEKGFKREDLDKKDGELKEKLKNDAVRRVRLLFILDEIARIEKIDISAEDTAKAYESISAQTGKSAEEVKSYYEKEELTGNLEEKLREGKVIEFLIKNASITEA